MKNSGTKMNKWMYFQKEKNRRITLSSAVFLRYASNAVVAATMNWSFNRFICCENDIKTLSVSVLIGFCCSSVDKNQFMTIYLLIIICRHFVAIFFSFSATNSKSHYLIKEERLVSEQHTYINIIDITTIDSLH